MQVSRRDNTSVSSALNPSQERLKFRKYQGVINTGDKSSVAEWEQWRRWYHVSSEWDSLELLTNVILPCEMARILRKIWKIIYIGHINDVYPLLLVDSSCSLTLFHDKHRFNYHNLTKSGKCCKLLTQLIPSDLI